MKLTLCQIKDGIRILVMIAGVLLLCVAPAHASTLEPADLTALVSGSYGQRKAAIEKLVNADPALARPILQSLTQSTLLGLPDGRVLIKSDQHYTDPLTGNSVAPPTEQTRQPVLNNALRRLIQNALASMSLFAPDKALARWPLIIC